MSYWLLTHIFFSSLFLYVIVVPHASVRCGCTRMSMSGTPRFVLLCVYAYMRVGMRTQIVVLAGAATMLLSRQLAAKARGTQRL